MQRKNKAFSSLVVIMAYLFSCVIGFWGYLYFEPKFGMYVGILLGDIIATVIVFAFSYSFKNSSIYDPYWSVIPIVILAGLVYHFNSNLLDLNPQAFMFWATVYWGARLTHNWYRGWKHLDHEDWRYGMLRKNNPKIALFVDFSGVHFFPTVIVFIALIPAIWSFKMGNTSVNWLNWLGLLAFTIAMVFETVGDNQLRHFVKTNEDKSRYLKSGLWKYTRHPNYFGESLFWWSLYLMAWSPQMSWWLLLCPISITSLFVFISIPMMDKHMLKKRPHYADHMKTTSGFIPWIPKSSD